MQLTIGNAKVSAAPPQIQPQVTPQIAATPTPPMSPTPTAAPQELVTITQPVTIQIPYGTTVLHRERDFVHTKIRIVQKTTRFLESCASNVFDEVNPGHLLELLAQMIRADVDRLCHLGQRKLLIRMLVDKIPRFPDFDRLRSIPLSRTKSLQLR
jgi:hypothetical protein